MRLEKVTEKIKLRRKVLRQIMTKGINKGVNNAWETNPMERSYEPRGITLNF
jgi:hypothetical protein